MKYTTIAALLPLASAASLQYEISDFSAACTSDSNYCTYEISITSSDNPKFQQSCDAMATSDDGTLPAVSKTQCGTDTIAVDKAINGGLTLRITSKGGSLEGAYSISSDDLTTTTSGGKTVQSYKGSSSFTIDVISATASVSATTPTTSSAISDSTDSSSASSVSSSASSISTATSGSSSTTGSATSSSASASPTNGATKERAFAGISFAVGLMAFIL
ncbi:hypothetical protein F4805DRAFT_475773 [Annulohypoxylon moriforme]|nr:hypothetical protein F4805DRAFT_475773 [Annulohypoxylon moriforme]